MNIIDKEEAIKFLRRATDYIDIENDEDYTEEEIIDIANDKFDELKKVEKSVGWCCELCGSIIKGDCYNAKGFITHIEQCIEYEEEEK